MAYRLPPHMAGLGLSGGDPLPPDVRRSMEALLGARLDDVRIHVGPEPAAVGAAAFTVGSHVYFTPGQYHPDTQQGRRVLAHELAHVVQQRAGRARNPFGAGVAVLADPELEAEAERMGARAAAAPPRPAALAVAVHPRVELRRAIAAVLQMVPQDHDAQVNGADTLAFLGALSTLVLQYVRTEKELEEVQAMYVDAQVVVTANSSGFKGMLGDLMVKREALSDQLEKMHDKAFAGAQSDEAKLARDSTMPLVKQFKNPASTGVVKLNGEYSLTPLARLVGGLAYPAKGGRFHKAAFPGLKGSDVAVVGSETAENCATKLINSPVGSRMIVLEGGDNGDVMHAEQKLLLVLSHMLKDGEVPGNVVIGGAKAPCSRCREVLRAFNQAYGTVYGKSVICSDVLGQDREGPSRLSLKDQFPQREGKFETFVTAYEENLAP